MIGEPVPAQRGLCSAPYPVAAAGTRFVPLTLGSLSTEAASSPCFGGVSAPVRGTARYPSVPHFESHVIIPYRTWHSTLSISAGLRTAPA
eukprot:1339743-Rhodomonas_salina.4